MVYVVFVIFSVFFLAAAFCPNGWVRYDDSCYFFEVIQQEPWHVASNYCTALDAELVRIETEKENDFLKAEIKKLHPGPEGQFWTAGNDLQIEKEWIWAGTNDNISVYTDWAYGEPNQINGEEDCLSIYPRKGYHWNDARCDISMNYICEHLDPDEGGQLYQVVAAAFCPNGWVRYDDSCYFFENIQQEPWHVASNYCTALDAELVRIETERENNFLKAEIQKLHPGPFGEFWTAGNDMQIEKQWIWAGTNDNISEYTDWAYGEPSQSNGEEDCLAIYPRKGYRWNDEHCDKSMNYICEHLDPEEGGQLYQVVG